MDDLLFETFLPTIKTRPGDFDAATVDVWIAQFDPLASNSPGLDAVHGLANEELPSEETTTVVSKPKARLREILPAGLIKPAPRKRGPLYDSLLAAFLP
jgi:hypothetical protein